MTEESVNPAEARRRIDKWLTEPDGEIDKAALAVILSECDHNAAWMTMAHTLCTDLGTESGHIKDRLLESAAIAHSLFDERHQLRIALASLLFMVEEIMPAAAAARAILRKHKEQNT